MPGDELSGKALALAVAVKLGFKVDNAAFGHWPNGVAIKITSLPGYDWDLNAMAEIERAHIIPNGLLDYYCDILDEDCTVHGAYHATATQRARAFLKLS